MPGSRILKSNHFTRLRFVLLAFVAVVVGVNVYLWNARSLMGNTMPMPFGYGASVVLSGSMEPALSVGDLLIVREQAHYEAGDIVVYQSGSMPVVHRIVSISEEGVITRGDANNANDDIISWEILGEGSTSYTITPQSILSGI